MPTVEKTHGGPVHIRSVGRFERGDRVDIDEEMAAYLCDERDDFERVDGVTTVDYDEVDSAEDETTGPLGADPEDMIEAGECPWCSEYEGENVGMHASRSHPDEWDDYTED